MKLTISRSVREKLERARDLSRHKLPSGKLEELLELALDSLLEKIERTKLGKTDRPRKPAEHPATTKAPRRHVRREVVERDGERCAFVAPDGTRCDCRAFLEFDHMTPAGRGGGSDAPNMRLYCRTHNALAAEQVYGRNFVRQKIAEEQRRRGESIRVSAGAQSATRS